jgi:transcriptional regulator GlxA family with amidase domain
MRAPARRKIRLNLLAPPECTGAALYGLHEVFASVGETWTTITGEPPTHPGFEVALVAPDAEPFRAPGGVPVTPDAALRDAPASEVIVIPDLWVDPEADPRGRWPETTDWLRAQHARGALIATVCTGSVLLAETGLLDGQEATTHWGYARLFEAHYPAVRLAPGRILVPAGPDGRLITAGGASSWEDLALHLIARICGETEAVRTAKVFLFGDRSEGQLPYAALARPRRHDDQTIADCQTWIADHYAAASPVSRMVARSGLPERTFKRRFRAATGYAPVEYVQTLRIEEAKQMLETSALPTEAIAAAVGYEDPAFFRRLFKRRTGITPARYRQRFRALGRLERGDDAAA